jgi:DNA polymerase-3 subunit delta
MKRDLAAISADIKSGKGPQLLLVFGDDFQVQEACKALVSLLVPEERRGFNLERLDGRAAAWDRIEAALMTPPFLPGKKLVWVENTPDFFSREQKGELGEKILQLWHDGQRDEAGKLLMDLLAVEGWTQERWEELQPASSGSILELLDAEEPDARGAAEALLVYCKSRGMVLNAGKGAEEHPLFELLDRGIPEWGFLLLTALQVDRRTRLYKRFDDLAAALYLGLERDRSGRVSRESLREFINGRLRQAGKTVEPQAREMMLARAGDELRGLQQELDKLLLYVGERPSIGAQDVAMIFADQGEGWVFDLTRAIGERDAVAALAQLARLMAQGDHPLKLLGALAAEVRKLLAARQLIDGELRGAWKRGMSYQQFQQSVLQQGVPLITRNPYADYMSFQRADHFALAELRSYMEGVFEADLRLKSSGSQPRLVMEKLILGMCLGPRKGRGPRDDRAGI